MIEYTSKDYEKHRRKGIKTNEGYVFINPKSRKKIIKVIESKTYAPEYLEMKKHTIDLLLANKEYLRELKIAIPEEGVYIDHTLRGYQASYIKGEVLSFILTDKNIPIEIKIDCLKQIGKIIRDIGNIRNSYPHLSNLFYNDIHENNFMVTSQFEVIGFDFDSCSIQDNVPVQGLYSTVLKSVQPENNKYQKCTPICEYSSEYIPDENLELFSYINLVLNFMYGLPMCRWTPTKLDKYLNYLESKGANLELLYVLSYIFDKKENNVNPDYLLDYIKEIYSYSNVKFDEMQTLRKILR